VCFAALSLNVVQVAQLLFHPSLYPEQCLFCEDVLNARGIETLDQSWLLLSWEPGSVVRGAGFRNKKHGQ
jgi:hypothetical protein